LKANNQKGYSSFCIGFFIQGENAVRDNEVLYIQGFKDGAWLMMEILEK
jgi:hypothetical protein